MAGVRPVLETYSTPFLYATFRFFSTGDYETDYRNYRLIQLVLFAVALATFARAEVRPLLLEVGLGGPLDSTSAVPHDVGILTALDLEHTPLDQL